MSKKLLITVGVGAAATLVLKMMKKAVWIIALVATIGVAGYQLYKGR